MIFNKTTLLICLNVFLNALSKQILIVKPITASNKRAYHISCIMVLWLYALFKIPRNDDA